MKTICSVCGFEDEGSFCSNCGARLPRTEGNGGVTWPTPSTIVRILGIEEVIKIVASVHHPAVAINTVMVRKPLPLAATLVAFGELALLLPVLFESFLFPILRGTDYPFVLQGKATEGIWIPVLSAISLLLIAAVVWILPGRIFLPNTKLIAFTAYLHMTMYVALYTLLADVMRAIIWAVSMDPGALTLFGGIFTILYSVLFPLYIMRHCLTLKWSSIILFIMVLGGVQFIFLVLLWVNGFIEVESLS